MKLSTSKFNKKIWLALSIATLMANPLAKAADGIPCNCENQLKDIERQIQSARELFDKLQAEVDALRGNPSTPALNCSEVAQNAPLGTVCKTSAQISFKREADGWRDLGLNGKLWLDGIKTNVTQYDAVSFCANQNKDLPSGYHRELNGKNGFPNQDSDFVVADSHGIREVFKDMGGRRFWSASVFPGSPDYAFVFSYGGDVVSGYRDYYFSYYSVRCVGR